jgi:hypothetical protein
MKKIILILIILILSINIFSQNNKKNNESFLLTGGISQITGFGGFEYWVGNSSFDIGIGSITASSNNKIRTTLGIGLSAYSGRENKNSTYLSFGYMIDGVNYNYLNSYNNLETKFEDTFTVIIGYRFANNSMFSLKSGIGYFWADDIRDWTFEVKLGIRLKSD